MKKKYIKRLSALVLISIITVGYVLVMQILAAKLEQVSPLGRLSGGYGFITDTDGHAVTSAASVEKGDLLSIRLRDGAVEARAETVNVQQ